MSRRASPTGRLAAIDYVLIRVIGKPMRLTMQSCGQVDMFTAHHDPSRCFAETVDGSFPVIVTGSWFPRAVLGKAHALCAYVRCLLVAAFISWLSWRCAALRLANELLPLQLSLNAV